MNIDEKYELLKSKLRDMGKVVIAYSGGVDSNFLLKVASDELGQNAIAVTITEFKKKVPMFASWNAVIKF